MSPQILSTEDPAAGEIISIDYPSAIISQTQRRVLFERTCEDVSGKNMLKKIKGEVKKTP